MLRGICSRQINTCGAFTVIAAVSRVMTNLSCLMGTFPARTEPGSPLPSCFSPHPASKQVFVSQLLYCNIFHIFVPLWLIVFCLKWPPKCSTEVRSWAPQWKKAVTCPMEKTRVREAVCRYNLQLLAVSSTIMNQQHILNKVSLHRNAHKTRLCIDQLTKM